jgi:alkylation response protein AidB-like acyl-CoA dehydrogenase
MTLDLEFDEDDAALASSVKRYCADRCSPQVVAAGSGLQPAEMWPTDLWPNDLWRGFADLGVLALATPEGGGGATSIVAAMEQLGLANAPGPFVATFAAGQLLHDADRKAIGSAEVIVSMGEPPLMPWLPVAGIVIELAGDTAYLARVDGPVEAVDTLGGEPWARGHLERIEELAPVHPALDLANAALAAYLAGAGQRLLEVTSQYAADRVQFRTSIGTFQAVAHPLADSALRLSAARSLARVAAYAIDRHDANATAKAASARISASRAALDISYRAHQFFGALGFTVEGPIAGVSSRIRQLSMLAPRPAANRDAVLAAHGL